MSALEMHYRRLLAIYPRDHRAVHEEEMLGVLLAAAKPEQRRPGIRDTVDLLRGGLLIRLRRVPRILGGDWSDALAIVAVLASLLLCMALGRLALLFLHRAIVENRAGWSFYVMLGAVVLAWPAVLLLALVRLRRAGVIAAWVMAAMGLLAFATQGQEVAGLGLLAASALTFAPGLARGIALIGRTRLIVYLAGLVGLGSDSVHEFVNGNWPSWAVVPELASLLGVLLVCAAAFRFDTATARRASLLLALPLGSIAATSLLTGLLYIWTPSGWIQEFPIAGHTLLHWIETLIRSAVPITVFVGLLIFNRHAGRRGEAVPDAGDRAEGTLPPTLS